MAGYVCAIAGGNGGVGKTTTAINVGTTLQALDYDVAVIDADLGMPNIAQMLDVPFDASLHDILAGRSTISETLTSAPGGMTIIPGEPKLEAYADANPRKLRKVVKTLRRTYDVVIVDTAAGLRKENTVLLELADGVVLTTVPDHVSLTDTDKTRQLVEAVDSDIVGVLIVRATAETPMTDIDADFDVPVLGAIPHDPEASGAEPMAIESPDSTPAAAYQELAESLAQVFFEAAKSEQLEMIPTAWLDQTQD